MRWAVGGMEGYLHRHGWRLCGSLEQWVFEPEGPVGPGTYCWFLWHWTLP